MFGVDGGERWPGVVGMYGRNYYGVYRPIVDVYASSCAPPSIACIEHPLAQGPGEHAQSLQPSRASVVVECTADMSSSPLGIERGLGACRRHVFLARHRAARTIIAGQLPGYLFQRATHLYTSPDDTGAVG